MQAPFIDEDDPESQSDSSESDNELADSEERRSKPREWKKEDKVKHLNEFVEAEGPVRIYFENCSKADDVFLTFLDEEIREQIIFQTNLYATQKARRLAPLQDNESLGFLGINILMGYHELPSYSLFGAVNGTLELPLYKKHCPEIALLPFLATCI